MAGSTNFVQINPTAANQQSDSTFDSYSLTTGGVGVDAILPSPWLNKAWFQSSTFVAALAAVIANFGPGYTITDTSISALQTQLLAFFNNISTAGFTFGSNSNGHWVKDPTGLIRQWNNNVVSGGAGGTNITFPTPFTNAASVNVQVSEVYSSGSSIIPNVTSGSITTTGFNGGGSGSSNTNINWFAIGY